MSEKREIRNITGQVFRAAEADSRKVEGDRKSVV